MESENERNLYLVIYGEWKEVKQNEAIRSFAEFVGYTLYHGEMFYNWRCPNKKCGMGVSEAYSCCPYCGQKIKFEEPLDADLEAKMICISAAVSAAITKKEGAT